MFDLNKMSLEELRILNSQVVAQIKHHQTTRQLVAGSQFNVGDKVKFTGRHGLPLEGTVQKINGKSIKVQTPMGIWSISPSLLTKA